MRIKGLISIVIPAFNSEKYIKDAIDSALSQTYKKIEVIVIDQSLNKNTESILSNYIKNKKIIYIKDNNRGPAAARNKGMIKASGEYIAFLDSDDIWMANKLEKQIKYFKKNVGLVYTYREVFGVKKLQLEKQININSYTHKEKVKALISGNFITTSSVIIKNDVIKKVGIFNENDILKVSEDYDYWIRIIKFFDFACVPESLVRYRYHNNQLSKKELEMCIARSCIYKKLLYDINFRDYFSIIIRKYIKNKCYVILNKLK